MAPSLQSGSRGGVVRLRYCFAGPVLQRLTAGSWIVLATVAIAAAGCSREDERLQQHREKFESLGSSAKVIGEAWLAGSTSGTYTSTALEQTFLLVEKERSTLASSPDALVDPRGAELSQAAERLSRVIASMTRDVRAADAASVRLHLASIPIKPAESQ
jgi:hypothetical protein